MKKKSPTEHKEKYILCFVFLTIMSLGEVYGENNPKKLNKLIHQCLRHRVLRVFNLEWKERKVVGRRLRSDDGRGNNEVIRQSTSVFLSDLII